MADIKINVGIDLSGANRKLSKQNLLMGRFAMVNQILLDVDQYVPRRHGFLRANGHVANQGKNIVWSLPYARSMYYGKIMRKGATYPIRNWTITGTGDHWDKKAEKTSRQRWVNAFLRGTRL